MGRFNYSRTLWKLFIFFIFLIGLFIIRPNPPVKAVNLRYPNLKTLPPRDLRFDWTDVSVGGTGDFHNVLRFTNTVYNVGEGKMEMWGSINPISKNGLAYQRVYDSDGTYTDYQVGIFYYHLEHDHYHFEDWGQYELWTKEEYDQYVASGNNEAGFTNIGVKTTSCVMDEEFIMTLVDTPYPAVYPFSGCVPNAQNDLVEGLSVGWGDTYDYYRYEQWIDLGQSTLADGEYVLRSISDPLNKMYESPNKADDNRENVADNEAITIFTVSGGQILDSHAPSGTVFINNVDPSTLLPGVTVNVIGRDDVSGVKQVRLSNDGTSWATFTYTGFQSIPQAISWNLSDPAYGGNGNIGEKTVYAIFRDAHGNESPIITDTIILGAIPPDSDYSSAVIADSPVSYWRLSENGGTTATDNQGGNHGLYNSDPALGGASLVPSDASNGSVTFDGVNDFVSVNSSASLAIQSAVTLEAWIKPTSLPGTGTFASILTKPESYSLQFNGANLEFTIMQNGTRRRLQAPTGTINAWQTYHVVGTYDGTTQKLFVNGSLVASQPLTGAITTNNNSLFIGAWNDTMEYLSGTIDEVAIYNTVLSNSRIISHYDAGIGSSTSGPDTQIDSKPSILSNIMSADFTFSSPDSSASFECSLDGAAFSTCTSPLHIDNLDDGTHILQVRAKSLGGVTDATPASFTWTIDTIAPGISSISRQFPSPTNLDALVFRVTFDEAVTNVDTSDFAVNGSTTATITNVTLVTTSIYKVTISGGDLANYNGNIGLNFGATDISDLANNSFAGGEPTTDETFSVDNIAPTVTSITLSDTNPTSAPTVNFTVTFSENVSNVETSDFSLTLSGIANASLAGVQGTGSTRTVAVNTGSGNGSIRLDVPYNPTITDLAGNPMSGPPFIEGDEYTVSRAARLFFQSTPTSDGWLLESAENSGVASRVNRGGPMIFIGDDAANKQYVGFLSFDTSSLPDNAIVTRAALKFKYAGVTGNTPFGTHGNLLVDISSTPFSNNVALKTTDFGYAASKNKALTFNQTMVDEWFSRVLKAADRQYINKLGVTQFRLRFTLDDNQDLGADILRIFSGNASPENVPMLIIDYYLP